MESKTITIVKEDAGMRLLRIQTAIQNHQKITIKETQTEIYPPQQDHTIFTARKSV